MAAGSGAAWYFFFSGSTQLVDVVTHTVKKELLESTVVERGTLESSENSDIYCRVKARSQGSNAASSIRWVIDDGSYVKRGQTVVELDDSFLHEQRNEQLIKVDQALSSWVTAQEQYEIQLSANESAILQAKSTLELALIDFRKYVEGDYEQQRKDLSGKIKIAQSNYDMWRERTNWSDRMEKLGYYTGSQAQSERAKMESSEIELKRIQEELGLLDKFTKERFLTDLGSKVKLAEQALDRERKTANSNTKKADTDRQAKKRIYDNEAEKLADIEAEILKCKIISPQDGMVVYFIPESSRYGSSSRQVNIAVNETVYEGQRLMRIPNLKKMQVSTRVHEAVVSRVKGENVKHTGLGEALRAGLLMTPDATARMVAHYAFLEMRPAFHDQEHVKVYDGQMARIRVDSHPERVFQGHVKTVATVASSAEYYSSDVKVYTTIVTIDENIDDIELKPGMSAEVTILADRKAEPVLTVPVDAVIGSVASGRNRKCLVMTPTGPEERAIEIGLSNDTMAEVRKGLEEGEKVIRHPYKLLSDADKFRLYGPGGGPKTNDWGGGKGKGKGGMGKGDWAGKGGMMEGMEGKGGPPEGMGKGGRGKGKGPMPGEEMP